MKLPTSTEDWNSADNAMASELVPRVCGEYNIDATNAILVNGIYQYFSQRFGFVSVACKHRRHKARISRQLIKLKQQKKEARKAVRLAKRSSECDSDILLSLVRAFRKSVTVIRKIKRLEQKTAFQLQSKFQQTAFSSNFWKFSKDIRKANQEPVIPSFDELSAFDYFSSMYGPKHHLSFNHPKWLKCCENPTVILSVYLSVCL